MCISLMIKSFRPPNHAWRCCRHYVVSRFFFMVLGANLFFLLKQGTNARPANSGVLWQMPVELQDAELAPLENAVFSCHPHGVIYLFRNMHTRFWQMIPLTQNKQISAQLMGACLFYDPVLLSSCNNMCPGISSMLTVSGEARLKLCTVSLFILLLLVHLV